MAVAEGARRVEVRGSGILATDLQGRALLGAPASSVRVELVDGSLDLAGRRVSAVRLRPSGAADLRLNGRQYPGTLDVLRNGGGLLVVNELPFAEYLAGVLQAEASEEWAMEMLKAQAIVARTYAAYHRWLNEGKPFHLVASTANQQYAGAVPESSRLWRAVRETGAYVLLWEGRVFPAFYHTDSGGYTEDPRLVFTARNMPALRPVRSEFSGDSPYFAWNLNVPLEQLAGILRRGGVSVGRVVGLEVLERSPSLRVLRLAVRGTRGQAELSGAELRRVVGYDLLKSTLFAVAVDGRYARFAGRGYGHGVGLDQWGAKSMAEQGYTALEILRYYYPGAGLGSLR